MKRTVEPATVDAALSITAFILNFKRHMKKLFQNVVDETIASYGLECSEIIDILVTRFLELCGSNSFVATEKQAMLKILIEDLTQVSVPEFEVSLYTVK